MKTIDLRSDTITLPTEEMRRATTVITTDLIPESMPYVLYKQYLKTCRCTSDFLFPYIVSSNGL